MSTGLPIAHGVMAALDLAPYTPPEGELRPTCLGPLPIDVTSIDRLDQALASANETIAALAEALRKSQERVAEQSLAVEYAEAHWARRGPESEFLSGTARDAAGRRWYHARRDYEAQRNGL